MITPINPFNLQKKYGTLSQYAQRFMKSQIKSISFAMENFFSQFDSNLILQNAQKLKDAGLKKIGKDISEGVVISAEKYDYHVFSNGTSLNFAILKSDSDDIYQQFSLNEKSEQYFYAGEFSDSNIEDEMGEIIDFVSGKLFKAKKDILPAKISQPLILKPETSEKISKLNRILNSRNKIAKTAISGYIGENEEKLIDLIVKKFGFSRELYGKISDGRTKYEVRSSYKNYMPQPVMNKLGFKNIGKNDESVSLFETAFKNDKFTAIIITDVKGNEKIFVISKDKKTVQKNFPSKFVKSENSGYRIAFKPDYYTQNEIDKSNLTMYLSVLNKEMDLFIEHTQNWFKKKEAMGLIRSNNDVAVLDKYKDLLDDISSNFEQYRIKMRKYLRKPHKNKKFKTENNISTKLASTAVKFDNITPDGYDLRLSFPKVKDKTAMQLLVMRDDKIEKSFYIFNNKLLRFNIKNLNDKFFRYDKNLYYYDNKYLQESNLEDYLLLIKDKLHNLNEKLDLIGEKRCRQRVTN